MQMLSGMQGTLCVGTMWTGNGATGFVGVEMEVLPRARGNWVDLTSKLKVTEALTNAANAGFIQTNVLVRMRARTPPGGAVFGHPRYEREEHGAAARAADPVRRATDLDKAAWNSSGFVQKTL